MRELLVGAQAFGLSRSDSSTIASKPGAAGFAPRWSASSSPASASFAAPAAAPRLRCRTPSRHRRRPVEDDADSCSAASTGPARRRPAGEIEAEPAANDGVDESGYMSTQVFSRRRSAVRFPEHAVTPGPAVRLPR